MKRQFRSLIIAMLVLGSIPAFAQVPRTINQQGVLADAGGGLVPDGNYSITFMIYSAATGTRLPLWTETQPLPISKGVFNAMLGSFTALTLAFDAPYWLGMTIGTGTEMTPRIPFTSAEQSLNTRGVSDGAVTARSIKSGQVVKSVNTLTDNVTLQVGSNVTITPSGNSAEAGLGLRGPLRRQQPGYNQGCLNSESTSGTSMFVKKSKFGF